MQLATLNPTYAVTIANKNYPEPKEESGLTPFFSNMVEQVTKKLSLTSPRDMYPTFGKHVATFNTTFEQLKKFLVEIINSNMTGNDWTTIKSKVEKTRLHVGQMNFSPPPGLTAEVAIRPPEEQLAMLNQSIALNVGALTYFLTKSLDDLVKAQQAGLIEWFSENVVRFHFYLNSMETKQTVLGRKHLQEGRKHTQTTERETTKSERRQRHQHDLVDAKALPVSTRVPYRAERLVKEIPPLFKDYFNVVAGNQIFEHVIEEVTETVTRQTSTETWSDPEPSGPVAWGRPFVARPRSVWLPDPALVIGNYVVAGWGDDEEKKSIEIDESFDEIVKHLRYPASTEIRNTARQIAHQIGEARYDLNQFMSQPVSGKGLLEHAETYRRQHLM